MNQILGASVRRSPENEGAEENVDERVPFKRVQAPIKEIDTISSLGNFPAKLFH